MIKQGVRVRIPTLAKQWDDWQPGELCIMAFIHDLYFREKPEFSDTIYRMCQRDFEILSDIKAYQEGSPQLERLRRVFRIGLMDGYYTIQYRPENYKIRTVPRESIPDTVYHSRISSDSTIIPTGKMSELWYYTRGAIMSGEWNPWIEGTIDEAKEQWYEPRHVLGEARFLRLRDDFWQEFPSPVSLARREAKKKRQNASKS